MLLINKNYLVTERQKVRKRLCTSLYFEKNYFSEDICVVLKPEYTRADFLPNYKKKHENLHNSDSNFPKLY